MPTSDMPAGASDVVPVTVTAAGRFLIYIVFDKQIAPPGAVGVQVSVDGVAAGTDDEGGAGPQGDSPNPDYLWIDTIPVSQALAAGPHTVMLTYTGTGVIHARIDAILLQPAVEDKVVVDGSGDIAGRL